MAKTSPSARRTRLPTSSLHPQDLSTSTRATSIARGVRLRELGDCKAIWTSNVDVAQLKNEDRHGCKPSSGGQRPMRRKPAGLLVDLIVDRARGMVERTSPPEMSIPPRQAIGLQGHHAIARLHLQVHQLKGPHQSARSHSRGCMKSSCTKAQRVDICWCQAGPTPCHMHWNVQRAHAEIRVGVVNKQWPGQRSRRPPRLQPPAEFPMLRLSIRQT